MNRKEVETNHSEYSAASEYQPCWKCGEPLTPENAPCVEGGIECQSCLTVWVVPEEVEADAA